MDPIVWIIVAVIVVLVVLLVVGLVLKRSAARRNQERLEASVAARGEAAQRMPDVQAASRHAQQADAEAQEARARADRADRAAADAHRELAQEQAAQEDVVRRADELDPRVDTDADDYRPITGPDMKGVPPEQQPGRHQRPV